MAEGINKANQRQMSRGAKRKSYTDAIWLRNKLRRMKRHLKRHPNDEQAFELLRKI